MLVSAKVSPKRVVIHTAFHLRPHCCAEKLRVSRSSVYRLLHRGELDVVYILSAPRVTAESLDDYVETRLAAGTAVK